MEFIIGMAFTWPDSYWNRFGILTRILAGKTMSIFLTLFTTRRPFLHIAFGVQLDLE
jgi:hypothetical protein